MKKLTATLTALVAVLTFSGAASAVVITELGSPEWQDPTPADFSASSDDSDDNMGLLGFSVNVGTQTFDSFALSSNGYVELLNTTGSGGTHINASDYSYSTINGYTSNHDDYTTLFAAYDDLTSSSYGEFGFKILADRAIFFWDTETYSDDDDDLLNLFQIVLYANGIIEWNFDYANYSGYDRDLFTGLNIGSSATLHEVIRDEIPTERSFRATELNSVPEPSILALMGLGLIGLGATRLRKA